MNLLVLIKIANQNSELLSGATSLNEADELLDNKINTLSKEISLVKDSINNIETLSNITINEKEGNVENGIASLTINGDEIKLSDSYVSVEYQYIDEDVNFIPIEKSMTVEKSIKQLDSNFSKLVDEVLKDEKIIAASITQLNESAGFDENCKYIVNENSNILRNATSLSDADNLLDTEILSIREQINNLSSNVSVDININGVYSELIDNITTVTISCNNIPLSSDYINVTYPSVPTTEFIPVSNEDDVESAIKKLDTSLSKLVQEVLDDEEVTSAALTEHNQSCGFNENGEYVPSPSANYISNALSLYEADIIVDNKIKELEDKILLLETQLESVLSRLSDLESANQV